MWPGVIADLTQEQDLQSLIQKGSSRFSTRESSPRGEGSIQSHRIATTDGQIISKHSMLNQSRFEDDSHTLQLQFSNLRTERSQDVVTPEAMSGPHHVVQAHQNHDHDSTMSQRNSSIEQWRQPIIPAGMNTTNMNEWGQEGYLQHMYDQPITGFDPITDMYGIWDDGFQFIGPDHYDTTGQMIDQ